MLGLAATRRWEEHMSRRPLFVLLISLVGLAPLGCSGSETQDVLQTKASSSSSASDSSNSATNGSSGHTSAPGPSGTSDAGTAETCTPEKEPNDTPQSANRIATTSCGSLSSNDKVDYLWFELAATTKTMSLNFTGDVRLSVMVKGHQPVELDPKTKADLPFVIGERYTVAVTPFNSAGGAGLSWTVTLVEK